MDLSLSLVLGSLAARTIVPISQPASRADSARPGDQTIMDMKTWLDETSHAVSSLIPLVWSEHAAVAEASAKLAVLEETTERGYRQSEAFMDDFDDEGLATAIHWETYFGPDKDRYHAAEALDALQATLDTRGTSRASMAGALLQVAKQGISAVHGGLGASPSGRDVAGVALKDLIWQARNQSMHWEEGQPHKAVADCFETLKAADAVFGDYPVRNLAFEVVDLVGWETYGAFEADLLSLA
jgi:hypothetical protein